MTRKRLLDSILLFAVVALMAHPAFADHESGQASGTWIAQASPGAAEYAAGDSETKRPGRRNVRKGTFTDSDGTGWNYCPGRCKKMAEKIPRAGGGRDNVIRIRQNTCKCSCVLFKQSGGQLVKKLEVTGNKGYLNIGEDDPSSYTVRCCEED